MKSIKRNSSVAMMAVLFVFPVHHVEGAPRTWRDVSGNYSIDAKFVDKNNSSIRLRKAGGAVFVVPLAKLSEADRRYVLSPTEDVAPTLTDAADHGDESGSKASIKLEGMKLEGDDAVLTLKEPLPTGAGAKDLELRILYLQDPHGDSITRIDQVDVSGPATFILTAGHALATARLLKSGAPVGFHITFVRIQAEKDSPRTIRAPINTSKLGVPAVPRPRGTGRIFAAVLKRARGKPVEVMSDTVSVRFPNP